MVRPIFTGLRRPISRHESTATGPAHDSAWAELEGLTAPPQPFELAGLTAHTLGYEDTLGYLSRHLTSHVNVWDFGRLIWVADIVSLAERFAAEVDWEHVRRRYPAVLNTLSLLHFMTPLSDDLLSRAAISLGRAPQGIGVEFQGWPKIRPACWREKGYRRVLRDTLFPSEWWLRFHYQVGSAGPLFWYRWVRHPLHILGHIVRAVLERLGWPTPLALARGRTNNLSSRPQASADSPVDERTPPENMRPPW